MPGCIAFGMIFIATVVETDLLRSKALPSDETSNEVEFSGDDFSRPNVSRTITFSFLSSTTSALNQNFQPSERKDSRREMLRSQNIFQNSYFDPKKSAYYAVIVCSASIVMFSILLLLLLLVCRLRKKDEGSYSLDESNVCFP